MELPAEARDADLAGPLEEEGVTGQVSFKWACKMASIPSQEPSGTDRQEEERQV